MTNNKYLSLIFILLATFSASAVGSLVTISSKEPWYSEIVLPSFNPPSWVFGPVWTTLYFLMSIAAWYAWTKNNEIRLLKVYFLHIFFNAIWSVIFFGFHMIGLALIDLIIILAFIIFLMNKYFINYKLSFYLFIPYLLWSSYALILNFSIFILN